MSRDISSKSLTTLVKTAVESRKSELHALSDYLWQNPELALEECKAHEWLTEFLEAQGFQVQRNWLLDTAFRAEFDNTRGAEGPTVAFLCEYDALPEIGHACGHNLIAECSVAAAIAVKEVLLKNPHIRGKVLVIGTPGEENCGGKEMLLKKDAFQDVDAALIAHPFPMNVLRIACNARQLMTVQFRGRPAHAAGAPWDGVNALDAAFAAYMNVSMLRQQMKPEWKVHGVMLQAGTYPNIIPEKSVLRYMVRAPNTAELNLLLSKVEACFEGAAEATGCSLTVTKGIKYEHMISNITIIDIFQKHAEAVGMVFEDADPAVTQKTGASTDTGNVSQVLPTVHPVYALRTTGWNHTREFASAAGNVEAQEPTLKVARAMALTVLDLLKNPDLLRKAKQELTLATS